MAEDALHRLHEGLRPCVVVVDVVMPDVDGWTFVESLRADPTLAGLSVIMHSGIAPDAARAGRLGAALSR